MAVDAAAPEAARLASRVEAGQRPAAGDALALHAAAEVGLETAEGLAQQHVQAHRDQRTRRGIEQPVRGGGADQAVAEIAARAAQRGDLGVLGEAVAHLGVPGTDRALERAGVDQVLPHQCVHLVD